MKCCRSLTFSVCACIMCMHVDSCSIAEVEASIESNRPFLREPLLSSTYCVNSWLVQIQRSRQGDCCRRGRRLREVNNERLQVTFLLFIRYNSRYFYNKSCCFHSFSPYTIVFHCTEFCIAERCIPFLQEIACFCCRSVLIFVYLSEMLLSQLLWPAGLWSLWKIIMQDCWLALSHSLSLLCITFSIRIGSSEHLHRKEDLGIRIIPVLCARTESSDARNYLNQRD